MKSVPLVAFILLLSAGFFEAAHADRAEDGLVISDKQLVPHDLITVKGPNSDFLFRIVSGETFGNWQDSSSLSAAAIRGKTIQVAVNEQDYESYTLTLSFETNLSRYFIAKVRSREQWGARPANPDMAIDADKRVIAVHHTAGHANSEDETVRNVQSLHMGAPRKWSDLGYHFLISPDGKIFEGRKLQYAGAHIYGHNKESIGLNFLGCYDSIECHAPHCPEVAQVTEEMISAMGELIGVLSYHFDMDVSEFTVKGHREFSGAKTACPGDRVLARMGDIRALAQLKKERARTLALAGHADEL